MNHKTHLFKKQQREYINNLTMEIRGLARHTNPNKVKGKYLHRRNQKKIAQRQRRKEFKARFTP